MEFQKHFLFEESLSLSPLGDIVPERSERYTGEGSLPDFLRNLGHKQDPLPIFVYNAKQIGFAQGPFQDDEPP